MIKTAPPPSDGAPGEWVAPIRSFVVNRFVWVAIVALAVGWCALRSDDALGDCISHGEQIELEDYLAPQGFTLVEFGAVW